MRVYQHPPFALPLLLLPKHSTTYSQSHQPYHSKNQWIILPNCLIMVILDIIEGNDRYFQCLQSTLNMQLNQYAAWKTLFTFSFIHIQQTWKLWRISPQQHTKRSQDTRSLNRCICCIQHATFDTKIEIPFAIWVEPFKESAVWPQSTSGN